MTCKICWRLLMPEEEKCGEVCVGCKALAPELTREVEQRPACPSCGAATAKAGDYCAKCQGG